VIRLDVPSYIHHRYYTISILYECVCLFLHFFVFCFPLISDFLKNSFAVSFPWLSTAFLFEIFLIIEGDLKSIDNFVFTQSEYKVLKTEFLVNTSWIDSVISPTNVDVIGSVLFTYYSYFFIMASVILLVAMIGAIALTLHRRSDIRRQDIYRQLQRDFEGATNLVDKKI